MSTRRETRRSAARTGVVAGVSLVVVAALVVGAWLLLRDRWQSGPWPPAAAAADAIICGAAMPSVADPDGAADVHLTAAIAGTDGAPVAPLSALAVEGELVVGAPQGLPAHRALEPVLVVVDAAGVVVGGTPEGTVPDPEDPAAGTAAEVLPAGATVGASADGLLYGCTPGTAGHALVPGDYQVYLAQTLLQVDSDGGLLADGERLTVVSEPLALTIAAVQEEPGSAAGTALGNLEISALGLESLRIGDAPPATPSAGDIVVWDDARCDDGGRWVPAYADRPGADGVSREPFEIWTSNGVISQIAVRTPGPRTPAGIQVGDTLTSLVAAYPGLDHFSRRRPANEPEIWAIGNEESWLVFEVVPTEPGSGWDPALAGRILAMSAVDFALPFQLASGIDTCTAPSAFVELR